MFEQLISILVRSMLADSGGVGDQQELVRALVDDLDPEDERHAFTESVDDALRELRTGAGSLVGAGDAVVDLARVAEGTVFAHRLTEEEITSERLDLSCDLAVLARIAEVDGGLHLPDAAPLHLHRRAEPGGGPDGVLLVTNELSGPPGWLDSWAADDTIAASASQGYLTIEPVDVAQTREADVIVQELGANLDAAFDAANEGDGSPVFAEEFLAAWLVGRWADIGATTPPFSDVLRAAGFELSGRDVGRPGGWKTHAFLGEMIGRIQRHSGHLDDSESAAMHGAMKTMDDWHDESAGSPDSSILDRLRAHPDAAMCLEEELIRADPDGTKLAAFLDAFDVDAISRRGRPAFDGLRALAAELSGDVTTATSFDDAALADEPAWYPSLDRRIRFMELRGEMRQALDLLQQTRSAVDVELLTMRDRVAKAFPTARRNEPCPCGSGRKFKQCHLGTDAMTPAVGVSWLLDKARHHVSAFAPVLLDGLSPDPAWVGTSGESRDTAELVALDVALFERGGLERFARTRRALLPAAELELVEGWIDRHRASVYRVEEIDARNVTLVDQADGTRLTAHRTATWQTQGVHDLVWCRLLPDTDGWWTSAIVRPVHLQERAAVLAACSAGDEAHFHAVLGDQPYRFDPPHASDGAPLVDAVGVWNVPIDRVSAAAKLDEVATPNGPDEVTPGEQEWRLRDADGPVAALYLLGTEGLTPDKPDEDGATATDGPKFRLLSHATSVVRHESIMGLVAQWFPDAELLSSRATPHARFEAKERDDDLLDSSLEHDEDEDGPADDFEADEADEAEAELQLDEEELRAKHAELLAKQVELRAQLATVIEERVEEFVITPLPVLGGKALDDAVADPALIADVHTLLREIERRESDAVSDRLRNRLGLDQPSP